MSYDRNTDDIIEIFIPNYQDIKAIKLDTTTTSCEVDVYLNDINNEPPQRADKNYAVTFDTNGSVDKIFAKFVKSGSIDVVLYQQSVV